jgi:hypothetical protein
MHFTSPRLSLICRIAFSLLLTATPSHVKAAPEIAADQKEFFAALKSLCGATLEGATEFPDDPKHPLGGKKLVLNVQACSDNEIRIPLHAGEDKSRTWVITLTPEGLLLKHDHRHEDGTPDEVTMYGGFAVPGGSGLKQQFAADADTARMIPDAATNVWTLELDTDKKRMIYALERHNAPRYRAAFSLVKPPQ